MTQLFWDNPLAIGWIIAAITILMLVWIYNSRHALCNKSSKKSSTQLTRQDIAKQFARFEPADQKIANLLYDLEYNKAIQRWHNMLLRAEKFKKNPCINDNCCECSGTGIKKDGSACEHTIVCTCPKCTAKYGVATYHRQAWLRPWVRP